MDMAGSMDIITIGESVRNFVKLAERWYDTCLILYVVHRTMSEQISSDCVIETTFPQQATCPHCLVTALVKKSTATISVASATSILNIR